MRRVVITLTEHEYADLEQRAEAERRSVKDMAGRLLTRQQPAQPAPWLTPSIYPVVSPQPFNPFWPPTITCDRAGTTATPPTNGTVMLTSGASLPMGVNPDG